MKTMMKPGLIIFVLSACAQAAGQALPDPTRPPAEFTAPAPGLARPSSQALPQLQSILIGRAPGGRRVAVIDGQTVLQGGSFRDATVTRIAPNEVELLANGTRQVLRLYPRPAALSSLSK